MIRMATPSPRSRYTRSLNRGVSFGPTAAVGSSRITTRALKSTARAKAID